MCDLDGNERESILGQVSELDEVIGRIRASVASIESRDWMDHEELDALFGELAERASRAQEWVSHKVAATHH
jgi:hypothetical protein